VNRYLNRATDDGNACSTLAFQRTLLSFITTWYPTHRGRCFASSPPVGRRRCRQAGCQDLTVRARGGQAELRARKVSQSQDAMAADILYGRFGYAHTRAISEKHFACTTTTSFAKV
jgi:hypothetical protein